MHEQLQEGGIALGNLKSTNILFNNKMEPCISEYGLIVVQGQDQSFLSQSDSFKTDALGTNVAYCTFKLDVYGFGVVLLELLTMALIWQVGCIQWFKPTQKSSEEIALYDHMCSYIWLCLVLLHISEIFRLKNGWKTFRLSKIDGNFPVISRRSYQKPSLKGNDFCRSRSHTDYCGRQSDCEWRWTDQSLHFSDCGTLVFLLAFHYMHQNFDEVDKRRSKEEPPYPK
ncbi:hypothetical protein POTOM_042055 [Populus tomentosa]|uniref:Protein kinase domain-containing protein n=1 Tax=Populus tomentosa TaxID=118781 RepID=A0A8X7YQV6_POPTO|nr:hypothetical protein POTOM_042055 [Populus tomentosa]